MFSESEEIFPSNFVETTRVMAVAVAASEKFVPSNLVIITKVMVVSEIIVISTDLRFEELRYWVIEQQWLANQRQALTCSEVAYVVFKQLLQSLKLNFEGDVQNFELVTA